MTNKPEADEQDTNKPEITIIPKEDRKSMRQYVEQALNEVEDSDRKLKEDRRGIYKRLITLHAEMLEFKNQHPEQDFDKELREHVEKAFIYLTKYTWLF